MDFSIDSSIDSSIEGKMDLHIVGRAKRCYVDQLLRLTPRLTFSVDSSIDSSIEGKMNFDFENGLGLNRLIDD